MCCLSNESYQLLIPDRSLYFILFIITVLSRHLIECFIAVTIISFNVQLRWKAILEGVNYWTLLLKVFRNQIAKMPKSIISQCQGVTPERHFSATWHGLNGNISFAFQAIQKPYHHIVNLCCGVFFEFLGDFWVYLGGVVFPERLVKLREVRNIEDLVKL